MKRLPSLTKLKLSDVIATLMVFISRLGVLPANVSPLGSLGFFGHPLLFGVSILAFDLGVKGIYPGFWLTYLGFAMYPLLGYLTKKSARAQLLAVPTASFLFFLFSNFGVWWYWYDHTLEKLLLCFTLALPFYTRTLLSDVAFGYGFMLYRQFKNVHQEKVTLSSQTPVIS